MKQRPEIKKGICSFCRKGDVVVVATPNKNKNAHDKEASICLKCMSTASEHADLRAKSTLYCHTCQNTTSFVLSFGGGSRAVIFAAGRDKDDHEIYSVTGSEGKWSQMTPLKSCSCYICGSNVPGWMVERNPYVNAVIKSGTE